MREIEFRGKPIDTNRDGEWVYGGILLVGTMCHIAYTGDKGKFDQRLTEVNLKTVGQYTGLKDRHGAKIFDGDILQDEDKRLGIVEFNKGRFVGDFDGRTYYYELYLDAETSEVIGNKHDNPELLEADA